MLSGRPTVLTDLSRDEDSKRETNIITRLSVLVFYSTLYGMVPGHMVSDTPADPDTHYTTYLPIIMSVDD